MKPGRLPFTVFLGALSGLPAVAIDMGLPGIPAIEATFAGAGGHGVLTLSLFLSGFAASPLLGGPLADRFGRRATLLTGLLLFSAAALACALATSFPTLLAFRMVQGIAAGACVALPTAIIRDLFEGAVARTRLSQVSAILGIAPMLAPMAGGWLMGVANWRSIYALQGGAGLTLFLVTAWGLTESLPSNRRRSLNGVQLLAGYRTVLADRSFLGFTCIYALVFAAMFSYIAGSPAVLMRQLGLSSAGFALVFPLTSCGVLLGSLASGALSKREIPSRRVVGAGLIAMCLAVAACVAAAALGSVRLETIVPLAAAIVFCFGLIAPNTTHEALRHLPRLAGAASGVMRCAQMFMAAVASTLSALLEPFGQPATVMSGLMAAAALAAAVAFHMLLPRPSAVDRAGC